MQCIKLINLPSCLSDSYQPLRLAPQSSRPPAKLRSDLCSDRKIREGACEATLSKQNDASAIGLCAVNPPGPTGMSPEEVSPLQEVSLTGAAVEGRPPAAPRAPLGVNLKEPDNAFNSHQKTELSKPNTSPA